MNDQAIGIDLGTTYSAAAFVDDFGKPRMLLNRDGNTLTPSVVQFADGDTVVVGEAAKNGFAFEPDRTVQRFKVYMGDPSWTFRVDRKAYSATQLSSYVLKRIKDDAERELGRPITKAVITVPAYFTDVQRVATKQAAEIAGLEVLQLVNEPTAAAIDYGAQTLSGKNRLLFVFDLGGGTLDATILRVTSGAGVDVPEFTVMYTDGVHDIGGIHWDELIVNRVRERFNAEHNINIARDSSAVADALGRAETAKKVLSARDSATVQVAASGERITFQLSRTEFELDARELVEKCRHLVTSVMSHGKLSSADIDEVILVGGATRMPMIQRLIEALFQKAPVQSTRVDESVARGAALLAHACLKDRKLAIGGAIAPPEIKITDVSSHSLGAIFTRIPERTQFNRIMIPRFSKLPASFETQAQTLEDFQTNVEVPVTEGESDKTDESERIGQVELPIPPGKRAGYMISVRYEYDRSGILTVTVTDPLTGQRTSATIESPIRMSTQQIANAARELALTNVD